MSKLDNQQAQLLEVVLIVLNHQQQDSNNNGQYGTIEYKTSPCSCDARECNNAATHCAKVIGLKKPCWLCLHCTEDFKKRGMVESILYEITSNGGESNFGE